MACNLAVSITRAAVTEEALLRLLTPEIVTAILDAVLADQRLTGKAQVYRDQVEYYGYSHTVVVRQGRVTVQAPTYAERDALLAAIEGGLKLAAGRLFSRKLAGALATVTGKQATSQTVQAEEGGVVKTYTRLSVRF